MVSVRIEEWPAEKIVKMDEYFKELSKRSSKREAKFNLIFAPVFNFFEKICPAWVAERGNCAYWTSKGLVYNIYLILMFRWKLDY